MISLMIKKYTRLEQHICSAIMERANDRVPQRWNIGYVSQNSIKLRINRLNTNFGHFFEESQ